MTYMWKYSDRIYRFQTNERDIQKKMGVMKNSHLVSIGMSENLWIYDILIEDLNIAWSTLEDLIGAPVRKSQTDGVYVG